MKFFIISFLIFNPFAHGRAPIRLYWSQNQSHALKVKELLQENLKVPDKLIEVVFKRSACEKKSHHQAVLALCMNEKKLIVLHKNTEALNNAYRIFRKK